MPVPTEMVEPGLALAGRRKVGDLKEIGRRKPPEAAGKSAASVAPSTTGDSSAEYCLGEVPPLRQESPRGIERSTALRSARMWSSLIVEEHVEEALHSPTFTP